MKHLVLIVVISVVLGLLPPPALAQDLEVEKAAITKAALDYIEGWFEGNAERMDRALHPQLAKRILSPNPQTGEEVFRHLSKEEMMNYTRQGAGTSVPPEKREIKVTVLDVGRTIASVRTDCSQFVDFIHLAKTGGQWKIVNVLWENVIKPRKEVAVDPKLFGDFLGEYELRPGFLIAITSAEGRLFLQATGQPQVEIFAESELKYFLKVTEAQVSFVRDDSGKVTGLILHQGGRDIPGRKIK